MESYYPAKKAVPHYQRRCHRCRGTGRTSCHFCGGNGHVMTGRDVHGNPKFSNCSACFGLKSVRCSACSGEGLV